MTFLLRSLVLYLVAANIGAAFMLFVVPWLAISAFGAWMPWHQGPMMAFIFGHYCFIRGWLVWLAAFITALLGFAMGHAPLRRAILLLPAWAPVVYIAAYMALVAG